MSIKDLDGDNITTIVIVIAIVATLIILTLLIKGCTIEETEMFLKAGCEKSYTPGRTDPIWTNCKRPMETPK